MLHDLHLALLSFKRTPGLTALMIGAIAVGIGAAMLFVSIHHAFSGNPIWWKDDRLYAVAIDNKSPDPKLNGNDRHPEYPSERLTYVCVGYSVAPSHDVSELAHSRTHERRQKGVESFYAADDGGFFPNVRRALSPWRGVERGRGPSP